MSDNASLEITYQVRVSNRAKHVRLTMSSQQGLVVVVPKGFKQSRIPALVAERRSWIERATLRFPNIGKTAEELSEPLPREISLQAVEQVWKVEYQQTNSARVSARSHQAEQVVKVTGNIEDEFACRKALRRWLYRHAQQQLIPWLRQCSDNLSLPFDAASIKGQKTRWASCSSRRTISINFQLLFLDKSFVEYVFIHELCHTKHMNHSPVFWKLVELHSPNYRNVHQGMRGSWQYIPNWLELVA